MKKMILVRNKKIGGYAAIVSEEDAIKSIAKMADECNNSEVSYKIFAQDEAKLEDLPEDVQMKVKSVLKAYNECNVVYEYNEFHVGTALSVRAQYGYDHFVVNCYKQEDVYTKEERIRNFYEEFGYCPAYFR